MTDLIFDLVQLAGLAYIGWRVRTQKPPDLKDLVRQALLDRVRAGGALSGRDRLRARLAEKAAKS